jgi:hypothetical protein
LPCLGPLEDREKLLRGIIDLALALEGAVSYRELMETPVPELLDLQEQGRRIVERSRRAAARAKARAGR